MSPLPIRGPEYLEVEELGGRRYRTGTVWYSARDKVFKAVGYDDIYPALPFDLVSGEVSWVYRPDGTTALRDGTGRFIPTGALTYAYGTSYGRRTLAVTTEVLTEIPAPGQVGPDQQIIERLYIRTTDGRVHIEEIHHGLGNDYGVRRTGARWFRAVAETILGDFPEYSSVSEMRYKFSTRELQRFVWMSELVLQTNITPGP